MSALSPSIRGRLEHQLDAVALVIGGISSAALKARTKAGKWSAHENLAHLVQHHRATLARLRQILVEDRPHLPSYKAETDPEWPRATAFDTAEIVQQLKSCRAELNDLVLPLSPEQVARTGIHPAFGEMTIAQWLDFFLLHEAHHLYLAMNRARGRE